MASEDRGLELEDGEINDLEDGEIDEDVPPARESNNNDLSLLLGHRHDQHSIHEQYPSDNSFETKNRDFGFQNSNLPPGWWETRGGSFGSFRGRFPRHRGRGRGKVFRGNGREKTYPAKRGNSRRPFLRRPNLPYPLPTERPRSPYPDERLPLYTESERARIVSPFETRPRPQLEERRQVYLETDRPRLPRPSTSERRVQRLPLMELEEKSRQFHSESSPSAPDVREEQPGRVPSPFDEEVDDYRILLQRHRLIQQQLAALENQENSSLGDDTIIDDTFIDIPVDDSKPDLVLENEMSQENFDSSRQDGFYLSDDMNLQHMGSGNEIEDLEKANEILDNESTAEPAQPKPFLPFKIKALYNNVPSIKELSQKDLEQWKVKGGNSTAMESGRADELERTRKSEPMSKIRKNRKKRKRKVLQGSVQNSVNSQKPRAAGSNQGPHVDPHNELEARLFSLAGSSVPVESNSSREDINKKQERRERLRQWQEKMNNDRFSDQKNQQGNKGRGKKKMAKPAKGSRRSSSLKVAENEMGGDRASLREGVDPALFENDDYFEIPMDVESDSTDGPALPLIDEPAEDFPPPPPPLPSGESAASVYMDPGQPALMMYPPGYFQNYADWFAGSAPLMTAGHEDQQFQYQEFLGKESHPLEVGTTKELPQVDSRDVSSQENSDEDDEVALREQLLKSLAVKRKAKIDAGKGEESAKNESGPRSPSTKVSKITTNTVQPVKQQQDSRQVTFAAPPKHDPVVIKLGEDSDTDESDASDTEFVKKAAPNKKKSVGGGLFGGLEMMIKEARKSAEASKVKATEKSQAGEGIQKGKTDQQPPEPTTPDAMAHMPEQMKTEYKRLKEQLALHESKTRQPLTTVNQEKEAMLSPATPENEEINEIKEDDSHLKGLHSFVTSCEENLIKHKKFIQKEKVTLNKLLSELLQKKRSLEAQEENVRKLQKELEAAQKVSLANKMLMNKLRSRTKLVKDRLGKRQLAASTFEEELLRAKSIISAVKRKMPMAGEAGSGRNSPQMEPLGNVSNENQKFTISPTAAWEIKNSLEAKFEKLSTFIKQDTTEKRKLEASESSSEATLAKKAKQVLITPQGSPTHSATTTPRKSAVAERIAQEKARLKKLEHELSEKLKQFGREREGDRGSAFNASEKILQSSKDSSDVKTIGKEEKKNEFGTSCDNTSHLDSQEQGFDSREASGQFFPGAKEVTPLTEGKTPITFELQMTTQQLEHVRKLQAEREKIGPQFPACTLDVPLTADQHSTLCVCLPFGYELKSIARDQDNMTEREDRSTELAVGELRRINDYEATPVPFGKYHSNLLHFKSYRLSPYFRLQGGFSLTSLTFSNKVDPTWPLCNFDLQGKCNDEDCKFQHFVKCKLSQEEILQDLAAYNPNLTVDFKDVEEMQESVETFTKAFTKQYQDKMSWDELCILLVNDVRKCRKENGPFNISLQPRTWKLQKTDKKKIEYETDVEIADKGKGIIFSSKDKVHGVASKNSKSAVGHQLRVSGEESQEIRYFLEEYNNIESLEASLENSPGDVALWLKLARLKLHENNSTVEGEKEDAYNNNVMQALSTLSRGLEENNQSEELWLEYLELYSSQSSREELNEICDQAVEFSPTYNVWWKYLEYSRTYTDKRNVCLRLIAFLTMNPIEPVELHSHFVLETLLYLIQLELYSGHYASAVLVFKSALTKRTHGCSDVPELSSFLLASDYCCAWLAYIHVVEFHRLPSPWFDPSHGEPSKMVTKEDFVFPWKLSQQSRVPGKKLLVLFQDALKACGEVTKPPFDKFTICLPLYKNLLALERAYGRVDSARGICRHLLKDHPSTVVLWQCLAALEDSPEKGGKVEQVYMEALDKCKASTELSYSAARFYLQQNEVQKAISVLIKSVLNKFAAKIDSQGCEVQSLAAVSSEDQTGDPVALYRRLLSLPLPYDYKCPPLLPNVEPQSLGKEKVFLWLSYCLLLEIAPPTNTSWDDLTPESAFETAVHSPLPRHDVQVLWTEYLFYQRSKALQERHSTDELVDRCLMSVSTSNALPHSSSVFWRDYRFHNQIISLSLSCHPQSSWSSVFQKYLTIFPGNVILAIRACQHEVEGKNYDQAKRIVTSSLLSNPYSISMWKVAISIELKRNCVKEARKMYHQATEVLPFAATVWKDFLMFELARSGDGSAVQEILAKSREIGVKLEEFLNTLLGK